MHIVLGLLGINVGEIHGNLSQMQVCSSLVLTSDNMEKKELTSDTMLNGLLAVGFSRSVAGFRWSLFHMYYPAHACLIRKAFEVH